MTLGHSPVLYTPAPGPLARDLQARSIPVVSNLRMMTEPPDIIHGQHTHQTLTALLAFPGVPAIQVHHGWVDQPPVRFPRIRRHVAVDDTVRDRLVSEWGVPTSDIRVIRNFVDPSALPVRDPLPARPARALVFSNRASHHVAIVRQACDPLGLAVDAVGEDVGRVSTDPGRLLPQYDIVFAKARCAMEAMAVGCAVVLCDRAGVGPMVDTRNVDELRRLNFGLRTLRAAHSPQVIADAVRAYDPADAARVSLRIREEARLDTAVDQLLDTYAEVLAEWQPRSGGADEELRSVADYLQQFRAEPTPGSAAAALLRAAYFRLARTPIVRWFLPPASTALRIHQRLTRGPG